MTVFLALLLAGIPINYGEPAQFTGQLLTTDQAIQLGQKAMHCDELCELKLAKTASVAAIRLQLAKDVGAIYGQAERRLGFADGYISGIEVSRVPWYEKPVVVAVVTAILVIATYATVREIQK